MNPELAAKLQLVKTLLGDATGEMPTAIADKVNLFLSKEIVDYQDAKRELDSILCMPEISKCTSDQIFAIRQVRKGVVIAMTQMPVVEPSI